MQVIKSASQQAVDALIAEVPKQPEGVTECWEDLEPIKNAAAESVLEFTTHVNVIENNQLFVNNLGDKKNEFIKLLNTFYTDIETFVKQIEALNAKREGRSGPIYTMEELGVYSEIAMGYYLVSQELAVLIGPTIAQMLLLVNDVIPVQTQEPVVEENTGA